jgi:glycosyltransferase involved in cell wall biosynthesis
MKQRSLRIAFIGARGVGGTYSGIETYYEELGSRLAAMGHEVTAYCRSYFTPDVETYKGIRVRRLWAPRSKHLETITHSFLSTLDTFVRSYDIIQYHAIGSSPLATIPRLFGRTTIVSVRGLDWQRGKWGAGARNFLKATEWASCRCPTATIVVSETLQQHYLDAHGRKPHFIPNAVMPPHPRPVDRIAEKFGLEKNGFLLFAGRLSPEKGVHTLLEAMERLRDGMPLAIAGGTSFTDGYIEQIKRQAGPNVKFLGKVDRETMQELYTNCYAYVLPSVMEGLSVGLLEALSYGACIVTTNIPENLEVVRDSAMTFTPGDVEALHDHLRAIVDDPALAEAWREKARRQAAGLADWDEVARRTEALYYRILGGAVAPSTTADRVPS